MRHVLGFLVHGWTRYWPAGPVIGGTAVVLLAVGVGLNRNVLYLSILMSAYIVWVTVAGRSAILAAGLGMLALLATVPVSVPDVEFMTFEGTYRRVQPGETVSYTFHLPDVGQLERKWGPMRGRLIVDGRGLSGLEVTVDGRRIPVAEIVQKYGIEEMHVPLEPAAAGDLTVTLGAQQGRPRIYLGPEVHGGVVYPEAVFVEVGNEHVAVIHHAVSRTLR